MRLSLWLKQEGDRVEAGEPIVEVETDKTNVELEAPVSGVLRAIRIAAGVEGLEAGVVLALIADASADDGAVSAPGSEASEQGPAVAISAAAPMAVAPPVDDASPPVEVEPRAAAPESGDIAATPIARRMAGMAGVALGAITGTGRDGRITKADVERVLADRIGISATSGVPAVPALIDDDGVVRSAGRFHDEELSAMRRVGEARVGEVGDWGEA